MLTCDLPERSVFLADDFNLGNGVFIFGFTVVVAITVNFMGFNNEFFCSFLQGRFIFLLNEIENLT